jgi:hypothetical protein
MNRTFFLATTSLLALALVAIGCSSGPPMRPTTAANARNDDPWLHGVACPTDSAGAADVRVDEVFAGTGAPVGEGQTVRVHYTASLPDGRTIRDSRDDGPPIEVIIGSTKTVCGFDRALAGMRAGGQRRARVPWALAFGENGHAPDVPPRTDVLFTIDLFLPADAESQQGRPPANPAGGMRRGR